MTLVTLLIELSWQSAPVLFALITGSAGVIWWASTLVFTQKSQEREQQAHSRLLTKISQRLEVYHHDTMKLLAALEVTQKELEHLSRRHDSHESQITSHDQRLQRLESRP